MKTFNTFIKALFGLTTLLIAIALVSCSDSPSRVTQASGPPQIERVSLVNKDSTMHEAGRGQMVLIIGNNLKATQSVTFNGEPAYVNLALATEDNIIVRVPAEAPFRNTSSKLVVNNSAGSDSLDFTVVQPPPTVTGFSPASAAPGDILTIEGTIFDNVETVRFGSEESGKIAEIISSTHNTIKVRVPEGIHGSVHIYVTTPGGTARSEQTYGFKLVIYDDALFTSHGAWLGQAYGADYNYQSTEHVQTGTHSIKISLTAPWGALQIGGWGQTPVDLSNMSGIKFSIYSKSGSGLNKFKVVLNGSGGSMITTTPGEWTTVTVPLSKLGDPSELTVIVIQNSSGTLGTFYIDNLGLI